MLNFAPYDSFQLAPMRFSTPWRIPKHVCKQILSKNFFGALYGDIAAKYGVYTFSCLRYNNNVCAFDHFKVYNT